MKKILIVLYFLFFTIGIISCNGQDNKSNKSTKIENQETNAQIPKLFDGKYFHGFQLSPNSDFPIYTHIDKNLGDLTVSFINKEFEKQKDWDQFDNKNGLFSGDDPDDKYFGELNKIIKIKLEPDLNNYKITAEFIPKQFLNSKTLDYIYPYTKMFYLYDKKNETWNYIKQIKISDSGNEKNITKLSELNLMLGIAKKSDNRETAPAETAKTAMSFANIGGVWSSDCKSDNHVSFSPNLNNAQFTVRERFSMNAQLKDIGSNQYKLYFTDFPPIIPLPKEMQNWENMDKTKPVGYFEFLNDSQVSLTWFGFYLNKTKKYIQTENPFDKKNKKALLKKCE